MRRLLLIVAALVGATAAQAQVTVFSARPDAVSLTVYREGIALISETRRVVLPAEPVTLVFEGVVESLLPRSAVMDGAGRAVAESDFRFDRLTPATLLQRSVGQVVSVVRTSRASGTVTRLDATIESAGRGVVLRSVEGNEALYCSGLPERLEFQAVPGGLTPVPTLSVRLAGGAAGLRTITVSYLARGFSWSADYVAHLDRKSRRMSLGGWITLSNETDSSFRQAQVQVVAGRLNLLQAAEGGSGPVAAGRLDPAAGSEITLLRECHSLATTTDGLPQVPVYPAPFPPILPNGYGADVVDLNIIPMNLLQRMDVVTGGASATYGSGAMAGVVNLVLRQELGDYQMYRLPWRSDLNARQTKQVAFLNRKSVKVERFYGIRVQGVNAPQTTPVDAPNLMLRWWNKRSTGLGEPLPAGMVRVFEPQGAGVVFVGESRIADLPVGLPAEIGVARALDLAAGFAIEDEKKFKDGGRAMLSIKASHHFVNRKEAAVYIELRRPDASGYGSPTLLQSTLSAERDRGGFLWRIKVPAGGEKSLQYVLHAEARFN